MIRLFVLPILIMHCSVPSVFLFSADYSCSAQHYGGGASGWGTTDGGQAVRPRVSYFLLCTNTAVSWRADVYLALPVVLRVTEGDTTHRNLNSGVNGFVSCQATH